jgi:hypothetical protein
MVVPEIYYRPRCVETYYFFIPRGWFSLIQTKKANEPLGLHASKKQGESSETLSLQAFF